MKIIASLLLLPCLLSGQTYKQQTYIPPAVPDEVHLGMPLHTFQEKVRIEHLKEDKIQTYKKVYFHPAKEPEVNAIIYHFDRALQEQPLYEIIVRYEDRSMAKRSANELWGKPNFASDEGTVPDEWRFQPEAGPELWCWVYKTTLVIVGKVPGTAWAEDWE